MLLSLNQEQLGICLMIDINILPRDTEWVELVLEMDGLLGIIIRVANF